MNSDNEYVSISELRNAFKSVTGDCICHYTLQQQQTRFWICTICRCGECKTWEMGTRELNLPVCGEDKFNGLDADIWSDWTPKYCPNCGALMDLKEETEFGTTL